MDRWIYEEDEWEDECKEGWKEESINEWIEKINLRMNETKV